MKHLRSWARTRNYTIEPVCVLILALLASHGCSTRVPGVEQALDMVTDWEGDLHTAERRAHRQDRPLLVYYTKAETWDPDPVLDALKSEALEPQVKGFVRCLITPVHESNRRYVNQFGINRTPAVIVIHRDGTYHSTQGWLTPDQVASFLEGANPPGATPNYNRHLPMPVRYLWTSSLDKAEEAAREREVPVLVVLDRPLTLDWHRLAPMLERQEVFGRVSHMVHCRPSLWGLGVGEAKAKFGANELPAIAIWRPGDGFDLLKLPNSYEMVVRFIDKAMSSSPDRPTADP